MQPRIVDRALMQRHFLPHVDVQAAITPPFPFFHTQQLRLRISCNNTCLIPRFEFKMLHAPSSNARESRAHSTGFVGRR